ncbi:MAG: hypothetical protein CM1200mP30_30150 [Pseudomonadota bacterium]|nr:MAG: hypothetical protein CM1200mP30_30150 [Pseudomonadota bacterium]
MINLNGWKNYFQNPVILTAILILGIYWVFFGEDKSLIFSVKVHFPEHSNWNK